MIKIVYAAMREYRVTVFTPAFFFGAVVFPIVIWAIMIAIGATGVLSSEKEPMRGTVIVADATEGGLFAAALREAYDPEKQRERAERRQAEMQAAMDEAMERMPMPEGASESQMRFARSAMQNLIGLDQGHELDVERVDPREADLAEIRERVRAGELIALIVAGERTLELPAAEAEAVDDPSLTPEAAGDGTGEMPAVLNGDAGGLEVDDLAPSTYALFHGEGVDPDHLRDLRRSMHRIVQDTRYRRANIDPATVLAIADAAPNAQMRLVATGGGEQESASELVRFLPVVFMMLLFAGVMTGGQYLLMGTLEEKGSRVMEVLLSAVSPTQLLVGKLLGQGAVGLTILIMYGGVGLLAADRFGFLTAIPTGTLPLLVVYFVMAYALMGAMFAAVGAAVTDYREANALFTPISATLFIPFVLLIVVMENPASIIARVFSYVPFTTPFVMAMRISQPAHPIPLWEIFATMVVGFAGVALVVWAAAKIFRTGALKYGKPPSFMGLLKWVKEA